MSGTTQARLGHQALKRLALLPLLLAVVAFVVFTLMRAAPGDPLQIFLGVDYTPEAAAELRARLGLDRPFMIQYLDYLRGAARGDFGVSLVTRRPIAPDLLNAGRVSAVLAGSAVLVAVIIGVSTGVISATRPNSLLDNVLKTSVLAGVSMPIFWLGLMMIIVFSVQLGWFPSFGWGTPRQMVLPVLTLATFPLAVIARMTRSCMLEVLAQDYVRTARANGLSEVRVVLGHAFKNALIPVLTVIGLQLSSLITGSVLTETVFGIPGLGRLTVTAITARDYPMVAAAVLLATTAYVIVNMIVDLLYTYLNPRIREL